MKVLIAMDSFKGSISSRQANEAVSLGIKDENQQIEIIKVPFADGGEGTVDALVHATNGEKISRVVTGPLHDKVVASYGMLHNKTAVIEVAAACGLPLVPIEKRNPLLTTTFGVGELICDVLDKGCRQIIIGLGGSATNDAGIGMLQALGFKFLNKRNEEVGFGGQALIDINCIDVSEAHPALKECTFKIACDVHNPLYGPNGAANIYGPQKGATPEMINELDQGLQHFSEFVKKELQIDIQNISGAGAAGGLGAAFASFLNGVLEPGINIILEAAEVREKLHDIDFIITGEGKLDNQSIMGKTLFGLGQLGLQENIPVIALVGEISKETKKINIPGITSAFSIVNGPMSLQTAMDTKTTFDHLRFSSSQLIRLIQLIDK